ncbi:MAG: hypothetical protein BWY29_01070 [Microgenomates group bacterium ADurb.Bin238]|nr:MAG: hypothetical protein BWY29_01070 [Microgenomates group bacterium ADurb.Bin238]
MESSNPGKIALNNSPSKGIFCNGSIIPFASFRPAYWASATSNANHVSKFDLRYLKTIEILSCNW